VGADPFGVVRIHDGFGGRADGNLLFQLGGSTIGC
jgi:hypothetical protein